MLFVNSLRKSVFWAAWLIFIPCLSSCRTTPKKESNSAPVVNGSVSGTIGGQPWTFARGMAYVSPSSPNQIVIGLYNSLGPTDCEVDGQQVYHSYVDDNRTNADQVTIWIPRKSAIKSFPWKSSTAQVSINDVNELGGGLSEPAKKPVEVEIKEITATQISGFVKATASNGNVTGFFTLPFCKNSAN